MAYRYSRKRPPLYTLCINGCQFKIILYAFKLAQLTSFESKNSFELSTQNEVSWANFNTYKRIFNWQPFMHRVYCISCQSYGHQTLACTARSKQHQSFPSTTVYFSSSLPKLSYSTTNLSNQPPGPQQPQSGGSATSPPPERYQTQQGHPIPTPPSHCYGIPPPSQGQASSSLSHPPSVCSVCICQCSTTLSI